MNKKKPIEILSITSLKGPNLWTWDPVIEALVDIGELEDYPSDRIPGLPDRLVRLLPGLMEHRCSYEEYGGFVRRLHEGTWPGHIMEHLTLELFGLAGMRGGFGRAREIPIRGQYKVIVSAWQDDVARAALVAARDLLMAMINDEPYDLAATVERLRDMTERLTLGPSTNCIVAAATARKIPSIRLNDGNLVQLGYGAKMRRIWTAETDLTSAIAEGISRDKDLTKQLLESVGVPVPDGRLVDGAADAWAAAEDVGVPVVVKPFDGNHGRGVITNLFTREEVERAFVVAEREGSGVLVERHVSGDEHRLLVVGNRMVAAARGESAWVTGDGRSTVLQLIATQLNTDPRRGNTEDHPLNPVRIDSGVQLGLERQGLTPDGIPAEGRRVLIQRNGNVANDCTDDVHPSVADLCVLAARTIGLDIAGIDLVTDDVSRPLSQTRGAIVEVNAGPGLLMHLKPASGKPRAVGEAIAEHLFPAGSNGRIPLVGICGVHKSGPVAQLVAHLLGVAGYKVGIATTGGLTIGRRVVEQGDGTRRDIASRLLRNRAVEAAVIESPPAMIAGEGMAYDWCQVGIVTDFDPGLALPDKYLDSPEQIWKVMRTQIDVVLEEGAAVLNAHEPMIVSMAELCIGSVIFYATDPSLEAVREHCANGGRAVVLDGRQVALIDGTSREVLGDLGSTLVGGQWRGSVDPASLLAAVAAAVGLGMPRERLMAGILSFVPILSSMAPPGQAPRQATADRRSAAA
ncbi:MAG: cyanophycin synthetase [Burkholderiaceae bacterium]